MDIFKNIHTLLYVFTLPYFRVQYIFNPERDSETEMWQRISSHEEGLADNTHRSPHRSSGTNNSLPNTSTKRRSKRGPSRIEDDSDSNESCEENDKVLDEAGPSSQHGTSRHKKEGRRKSLEREGYLRNKFVATCTHFSMCPTELSFAEGNYKPQSISLLRDKR